VRPTSWRAHHVPIPYWRAPIPYWGLRAGAYLYPTGGAHITYLHPDLYSRRGLLGGVFGEAIIVAYYIYKTYN
jgi:hypothetical protein